MSIGPRLAPDPTTSIVSAGGPTPGDALGPVSGDGYCAGTYPAAPQIALTVQANMPLLRVLARSDSDATIAVRFPDGHVECDDDSGGGLNPALDIPRAASGRYEIFVGTFSPRGTVRATVGFSVNPSLTAMQLP